MRHKRDAREKSAGGSGHGGLLGGIGQFAPFGDDKPGGVATGGGRLDTGAMSGIPV